MFNTRSGPHTFISPSADSAGAVVSYWRKYVHKVLVNCLGGLSLPRKSVVTCRLTDCPNMNLDVYRGCKTTTQHKSNTVNGIMFLVSSSFCFQNGAMKNYQKPTYFDLSTRADFYMGT